MAPIVNQEENITYVACSKRCNKKVSTAFAARTYPADRNAVRYTWEKDGKLGPKGYQQLDEHPAALVDGKWGENYTQYRGRNATGMTKANYAEGIAQRFLQLV
jgi:hypothetical protein